MASHLDLSNTRPAAPAEVQADWPKAAQAWGFLGVLCLANCLSFIDRTILSLLVAPIRRDLNISDTEISFLLGSAFTLTYAIFAIPISYLSDRGNRRNIVAAGIAIWSLMTALCGLANSYTALFLARMGVGAGESCLLPATFSLLSDLFPARRLPLATTLFTLATPIGAGLALIFGGQIVNAIGGIDVFEALGLGLMSSWHLVFIVVGLPGLLALLLLAPLKEPRRRGVVSRRRGAGESLAFLSRKRAALGPLLLGVALMAGALYGGLPAWLPTFFARTHGMAPADAAIAYGLIYALCGCAGMLAGGAVTSHLLRRGHGDAPMTMLAIAAIAAAPPLVAALLVSDPDVAIALLAVGMFMGAMQASVGGVALQLISPPPIRAQVAAAYLLVGNLGVALGPTIVALLTDNVFRSDAALDRSLAWFLGAALPLASLVFWLGRRAYRQALAENQDPQDRL